MLNARNRFQNGSFGDICSLDTNLIKYSFEDKSEFLLIAVPILDAKITFLLLSIGWSIV